MKKPVMKKQRLDDLGPIVELMGVDDVWGYYARGWGNKTEFVDTMKREYGGDEIKVDDVDHVHARLIPRTGRDYDLEFVVSKPGPGAFKCTFHQVDR